MDKQEEDLIHEQSIECLDRMGVRVDSLPVLSLLEEYGARIDKERRTAKLSEEIIDRALGTAPSQIILCGRNPENDLVLPSKTHPYSVNNGLAVFVVDRHTGEYRECDSNDLAEFVRLNDALDAVDFVWPALAARDKPPYAQTLYELWICMKNTSKHIQGDAIHGAHNARAQIELAALVTGGKQALKKRPIFSVVSCPISPLTFEGGTIEAQVELARAGIPIVSLSMSLGGLTAPVSIAGMMVNANAENLASLVITQAAAAGAPHIYGSDSTPMDMVTGNINYSAPEFAHVAAGLAQMAVRYKLPSFVAGFSTYNASEPGEDSIVDILGHYLASTGIGDITGGMGAIDQANGVCFKQMIVDAYTWESYRKFMKPVEITKDKIGLDAIEEVGHKGNFLTHQHTFKYLRKELTFWDKPKNKFLAKGRKEIALEAGAIANQILCEHQVMPLDKKIEEKGYEMILAYEKKYL
jgi:trimethylamine--corrinoid protein Co-methyltransferase